MASTVGPNPYTLFTFALRESDWELADLIASLLISDRGGRIRLEAELAKRRHKPGAPESLEALHRLAGLSRSLKLEPLTDQLPEDSEDADHWRPDAATTGDRTAEYEVQELARARYESLSHHHKLVVDLFVLDGYDAAETAEKVNIEFPELNKPMSDQNVHQIASRFRRDLRGDLESF